MSEWKKSLAGRIIIPVVNGRKMLFDYSLSYAKLHRDFLICIPRIEWTRQHSNNIDLDPPPQSPFLLFPYWLAEHTRPVLDGRRGCRTFLLTGPTTGTLCLVLLQGRSRVDGDKRVTHLLGSPTYLVKGRGHLPIPGLGKVKGKGRSRPGHLPTYCDRLSLLQNEITHTCGNITFARAEFVVGKNSNEHLLRIQFILFLWHTLPFVQFLSWIVQEPLIFRQIGSIQ